MSAQSSYDSSFLVEVSGFFIERREAKAQKPSLKIQLSEPQILSYEELKVHFPEISEDWKDKRLKIQMLSATNTGGSGIHELKGQIGESHYLLWDFTKTLIVGKVENVVP